MNLIRLFREFQTDPLTVMRTLELKANPEDGDMPFLDDDNDTTQQPIVWVLHDVGSVHPSTFVRDGGPNPDQDEMRIVSCVAQQLYQTDRFIIVSRSQRLRYLPALVEHLRVAH